MPLDESKTSTIWLLSISSQGENINWTVASFLDRSNDDRLVGCLYSEGHFPRTSCLPSLRWTEVYRVSIGCVVWLVTSDLKGIVSLKTQGSNSGLTHDDMLVWQFHNHTFCPHWNRRDVRNMYRYNENHKSIPFCPHWNRRGVRNMYRYNVNHKSIPFCPHCGHAEYVLDIMWIAISTPMTSHYGPLSSEKRGASRAVLGVRETQSNANAKALLSS